jgi:hypothetical protein
MRVANLWHSAKREWRSHRRRLDSAVRLLGHGGLRRKRRRWRDFGFDVGYGGHLDRTGWHLVLDGCRR